MDRISELRKKLISSARRKVQEIYSGKDVHIIKAVNILDDLDPIINLLTEQLREWHSVHFPELSDIVQDSGSYARLVAEVGERKGFTRGKVAEVIKDEALAERIASAVGSSIGSEVSAGDLREIQALALNCANLREEREYLTKYLEESMKEEMPSFTAIAGPVIGAKIFARAGGKKKLAFLPASTIQVIGAEKALFMHFRKGVPGPKHGYLYQHPLVKAAREEHKGRIARSIAAKLAIAARVDYFHGKDASAEANLGLEKRAMELQNAKPGTARPARPPQKQEQREWPRREAPGSAGRTGFGRREERGLRAVESRARPFSRHGKDNRFAGHARRNAGEARHGEARKFGNAWKGRNEGGRPRQGGRGKGPGRHDQRGRKGPRYSKDEIRPFR